MMSIGETVAEIWRLFDFFNMAAVRHLGFVVHTLSLSEIWLKSMQ